MLRDRSIVVFGPSGVGKTCFVDMCVLGKHYVNYNPTCIDGYTKQMHVDNEVVALTLHDLNASLFHTRDPTFSAAIFKTMLRQADGIVLLYDVTSQESYHSITTQGYLSLFGCRLSDVDGELPLTATRRFGCVLVGNKLDLADEKRQVSRGVAQEWADMQGMPFFEVDTAAQAPLEGVMQALVRSINRAEKRDADDYMERKRIEALETKKLAKEKGPSRVSLSTVGDAFRNVLPKSRS